jgi:AcrR family transcriptional regulator
MPYHHGHLREALVDAALETARAEGPDAVVLRAVTRAAGVTPNAAYRHFADRDQLLWDVAAECLERLARLIDYRLAEAPRNPDESEFAWDQLRVASVAYVDFALNEPGWFRTAFSGPKPAEGCVPRCFVILNDLLDNLVLVGALSLDRRVGAEFSVWSACHGIANLLTDGPLSDLPPDARAFAINRVMDSIISGLKLT